MVAVRCMVAVGEDPVAGRTVLGSAHAGDESVLEDFLEFDRRTKRA